MGAKEVMAGEEPWRPEILPYEDEDSYYGWCNRETFCFVDMCRERVGLSKAIKEIVRSFFVLERDINQNAMLLDGSLMSFVGETIVSQIEHSFISMHLSLADQPKYIESHLQNFQYALEMVRRVGSFDRIDVNQVGHEFFYRCRPTDISWAIDFERGFDVQ